MIVLRDIVDDLLTLRRYFCTSAWAQAAPALGGDALAAVHM
jgi:hypothetical protein